MLFKWVILNKTRRWHTPCVLTLKQLYWSSKYNYIISLVQIIWRFFHDVKSVALLVWSVSSGTQPKEYLILTGRTLIKKGSFFDRKKRPGVDKKKKKADVRVCWNETALVNYLVTYKTFKISYKTRHWQLWFCYFYWCYCILIIIYKITTKIIIS